MATAGKQQSEELIGCGEKRKIGQLIPGAVPSLIDLHGPAFKPLATLFTYYTLLWCVRNVLQIVNAEF
jgi:hypothetical protein